jgi:hypothetical protein
MGATRFGMQHIRMLAIAVLSASPIEEVAYLSPCQTHSFLSDSTPPLDSRLPLQGLIDTLPCSPKRASGEGQPVERS